MFRVKRLAVWTATTAAAIHERLQFASVPQAQRVTNLMHQDAHESAAPGFITVKTSAINDDQTTGTDTTYWGNRRVGGSWVAKNNVVSARRRFHELNAEIPAPEFKELPHTCLLTFRDLIDER